MRETVEFVMICTTTSNKYYQVNQQHGSGGSVVDSAIGHANSNAGDGNGGIPAIEITKDVANDMTYMCGRRSGGEIVDENDYIMGETDRRRSTPQQNKSMPQV